VVNATLQKQSVACPLVRDSGDQPFTAMFVRALDTKVGGGDSSIPRCKMMALNSDGSLDESAWAPHGNPSAAGIHEFDSLSVVDEFDPGLNGSASILCELGAFDSILGMRWEEDSTSISADNKIIPGSACYSFGSVTPAGWAHGAGWFNATQAGSRAECPIVRDESAADLHGAWVRLALLSAADEASCRLNTRAVTGSSFGNTGWEEHTGADGSSLYLDGDDMSAHFSNAAYWVECDLPSGGRLLSLRWAEN
jgi:hypothetical protein